MDKSGPHCSGSTHLRNPKRAIRDLQLGLKEKMKTLTKSCRYSKEISQVRRTRLAKEVLPCNRVTNENIPEVELAIPAQENSGAVFRLLCSLDLGLWEKK